MNKSEEFMAMQERGFVDVTIVRVTDSNAFTTVDQLAVEEPLEIRLSYVVEQKRVAKSISITMRTPGHDAELAVGFLYTEGILLDRSQLAGVHEGGANNAVCIALRSGTGVNLSRLERNFYTTSSCGVCGKASLEALRVQVRHKVIPGSPRLSSSIIHHLPEKLRETQSVFDRTGGLHASALIDFSGQLLAVYEDVGRHNALDKLIGAEFFAGRVPLLDRVLLVSGRVSFELVQKAAQAGIPVVAAVGAPSSLAISVAQEHDLTVLGFMRNGRFNIYSGPERVNCISSDLANDLRS